ncbi:MAG: hypothetical protein AAF666_18150 [Pseudomonadota bacterium]
MKHLLVFVVLLVGTVPSAANSKSLKSLLGQGGEIVTIHINSGYPEIYVRVSSPSDALFVCRVGSGSEYTDFIDYRNPTPPTQVPTVCAELN